MLFQGDLHLHNPHCIMLHLTGIVVRWIFSLGYHCYINLNPLLYLTIVYCVLKNTLFWSLQKQILMVCTIVFREQNARLVPLMLERMRALEEEANRERQQHTNRPFAHLNNSENGMNSESTPKKKNNFISSNEANLNMYALG